MKILMSVTCEVTDWNSRIVDTGTELVAEMVWDAGGKGEYWEELCRAERTHIGLSQCYAALANNMEANASSLEEQDYSVQVDEYLNKNPAKHKMIHHDLRTREGLIEALKATKIKYKAPTGATPIKGNPQEQLFEYMYAEYELFAEEGDFSEEYLKAAIWEVIGQ